MEPDKNYPLHSDDTGQPEATPTPSIDQQSPKLEVPSSYGQPKDVPPAQVDTVPWYLRPLTKTTQSPLTSTQTRPYVPRQPLPPQQDSRSQQSSDELRGQPASSPPPKPIEQPVIQAPPLSPFRSPSVVPPMARPELNDSPVDSMSSVGRFRMPGRPKQTTYQQALANAVPKPFSQFGSQTPQPSANNTPLKSGKFRKLIGFILALLLVGGIAVGVYSLWRSNTSQPDSSLTAPAVNAEDKLYQAIENHLRTEKIRQVFSQNVTAADASSITLDATSDFSDPRAPKSYIKYELKSGEGEAAIDGAGELIVQNSNEYYGKLTKPVLFYEGGDDLKPKEGQWYTIPTSDAVGEVLFDPLSARTSINSSLGEFPVGNFSDGTRQQLMQHIKEQNVYEIKSSEQVEVDGRKMIHYVLDINAAQVNELNKKIHAAVGGSPDETPFDLSRGDGQTIELWVSEESTKIAKIKIDRESKVGESGVIKESTTVDVTYPADTSIIAAPEDATVGPWRTADR